MNRTKLKNYAPQARRDFIQAITDRAAHYGLTANNIADVTAEQGDVAIIGGKPFHRSILAKRERLIERIKQTGFANTMEAIAYTWFNRFVAIRFMELHGYLDHGSRVLSHPEAKETPEILLHAEHVALPGLNRDKVIELKLDGTKESELYRLLLVAQCNALNAAMPFLFERVDDETELLLPDNLLHSDSLIRKLVNDIDESDWQQVEIIGWLYQFYISEKKDEVIGKTVKSEDIPAATQLFTPNWIVKYMTQNSLGRLWLEANPTSTLASKMEFFIRSRESEVGSRNEEEQSSIQHLASSISPEDITILDPACGSGHILVEAYDLLKEIYLERGYRLRDVPRLILSRNLFGLDIDERATQLASFALLMKARADDRRIFEVAGGQWPVAGSDSSPITDHRSPTTVNVFTIPDSSALPHSARSLAESVFSDQSRRGAVPILENKYLFGELESQPSLLMLDDAQATDHRPPTTDHQITEQHILDLLECFALGKTLGSLIRIPADVKAALPAIAELLAEKRAHGDTYEQVAARLIAPFVQAAGMLARQYDCVIANPPYMGGKGMNATLKEFAKRQFPDSKSDLFAMFIERNFELTKRDGLLGFMTPFVWMFLSSYEKLRTRIMSEKTILSLVRPEYHAFFESAYVPICTFVLANDHRKTKGSFYDLSKFYGADVQPIKFLEAIENPACAWRYQASTDDFKKIPGSPIAYWVSDNVHRIFQKFPPIGDRAKKGLTTGDNDRFLRLWYEVSKNKTSFAEGRKWFPSPKGGNFRKWFGNHEFVVNWENDGFEIKNFVDENGKLRSRPQNVSFYFREGVTWNDISASFFSARYVPPDFIFNASGPMIFGGEIDAQLCFLNSTVNHLILSFLSPTFHFEVGSIALIPMIDDAPEACREIAKKTIALARADWDSFETSWDFTRLPILDFRFWIETYGRAPASVEEAYHCWERLCHERIQRMQELETENNRLFIDAYGLQDELSPEVPLDQITLARPDREADIKRLLSYVVGCMMGRYSLDVPGLVYADSGNIGFDATKYATFPADPDAIVPVMETDWFADDATNRVEEFVRVVWGDGYARILRAMPEEETVSSEEIADDASARRMRAYPEETVSSEEIADDASARRMRAHPEETVSSAGIADDASARRMRAYPEENLRYIAESLGATRDDDARATIRRYFATGFFKDHLKTYKKRPIYWLFSSGKQRAFQCLVYLHRYHEGTLARMRTEYVIPLQGKLADRIDALEKDSASATSTSHRKKLEKERDLLKKQQTELLLFDEKLRHYADQRIALDLDDGVKVNYGKFGDLLAEVKAVTGGSDD